MQEQLGLRPNLPVKVSCTFLISCTAAETKQDSNEVYDRAKGSAHFMGHVLIRVLDFLNFISFPLVAPLELVV